jgi:hypothetical protein
MRWKVPSTFALRAPVHNFGRMSGLAGLRIVVNEKWLAALEDFRRWLIRAERL